MLRVAGIWWTLGGLLFLGTAVYRGLYPDKVAHQQTLTGSAAIDFTIFGAFTVSVGLYFAFRKPYRPDLGDTFFGGPRKGFPWLPPTAPPGGPRSWWTGEPRG
jgi:hypothetical protein